MAVLPMIDTPTPFASTKELQDFLSRWEGTSEAQSLALLQVDLSMAREELARRVFASDISRKQLEAILHPRIRTLWMAQAQEWRAAGIKLGVVVIPLLYETNSARHFDKVICVACAGTSQQQRLAARGWSAEQIQQRIAAQWPIERKMTSADHVVWAEGNLEVTMAQVDRILSQL